jgi:predicted membrane channel-forming protein YqfA (hemolysin III family)
MRWVGFLTLEVNMTNKLRLYRLPHNSFALFKLFPFVSAVVSFMFALSTSASMDFLDVVLRVGFGFYGLWMTRRIFFKSSGNHSAFVAAGSVFLFVTKGILELRLDNVRSMADTSAVLLIALVSFIWHYANTAKYQIASHSVVKEKGLSRLCEEMK